MDERHGYGRVCNRESWSLVLCNEPWFMVLQYHIDGRARRSSYSACVETCSWMIGASKVSLPVCHITLRGKIWNKLSTVGRSDEECDFKSILLILYFSFTFQSALLLCFIFFGAGFVVPAVVIHNAVWVRTPNSVTSLWMFWRLNLDLSSQPFGRWN
jgi:hypothetical protein